jgi:hypothetical protein
VENGGGAVGGLEREGEGEEGEGEVGWMAKGRKDNGKEGRGEGGRQRGGRGRGRGEGEVVNVQSAVACGCLPTVLPPPTKTLVITRAIVS